MPTVNRLGNANKPKQEVRTPPARATRHEKHPIPRATPAGKIFSASLHPRVIPVLSARLPHRPRLASAAFNRRQAGAVRDAFANCNTTGRAPVHPPHDRSEIPSPLPTQREKKKITPNPLPPIHPSHPLPPPPRAAA